MKLLQVLSSDGSTSGGVYWMFYSGGSFETAAAPAGLPGLEAGTEHEGLRCVPLVHLALGVSTHMHIQILDTGELHDESQ